MELLLRVIRSSGPQELPQTLSSKGYRAKKSAAELWLISFWRLSDGLGSGQWAIARQSLIDRRANSVHQRLSMLSARRRCSPKTLPRQSAGSRRGPLPFRPSDSSQPSESELVSPTFLGSGFRASLPGGSG